MDSLFLLNIGFLYRKAYELADALYANGTSVVGWDLEWNMDWNGR